VIEHPSDVIVDESGIILKSINMDDVNDSIYQTVNTDWEQLRSVDPRSLNDEQGDGIKSITFARWMMSLEDVQHTSYTKLLNDRDDISCIARFRLRSHNLNVELMRNAPRSARLCEYCMKSSNKQKVVEDELHFMLECPLFTSEREILLNQLKLDPLKMDKLDLMRHTMNPSSIAGWKSLIKYINMCNNKRTSFIM